MYNVSCALEFRRLQINQQHPLGVFLGGFQVHKIHQGIPGWHPHPMLPENGEFMGRTFWNHLVFAGVQSVRDAASSLSMMSASSWIGVTYLVGVAQGCIRTSTHPVGVSNLVCFVMFYALKNVQQTPLGGCWYRILLLVNLCVWLDFDI